MLENKLPMVKNLVGVGAGNLLYNSPTDVWESDSCLVQIKARDGVILSRVTVKAVMGVTTTCMLFPGALVTHFLCPLEVSCHQGIKPQWTLDFHSAGHTGLCSDGGRNWIRLASNSFWQNKQSGAVWQGLGDHSSFCRSQGFIAWQCMCVCVCLFVLCLYVEHTWIHVCAHHE